MMANDNGKGVWKNRIVGYGEENPNQLLANPLNFRIHPKDQQAATEGSLDTLGWIDDVIINKTTGHVVDGHLRVTLALRNNAATVPVKYVDLTEEEEAQALISLDPIAAMAATDKQKLDTLIHSVQSDDKRVMEYIAELAEREGIQYGAPPPDDPGAQIDKAEELRVKWGVESGQLWRLGEHRLICSDCTKIQHNFELPLFTDPPYGIDYEPLHGVGNAPQNAMSGMDNDDGNLDLSFLFGFDKRMIWGFPYIYDPNATGWIVWDKQPGKDGRDIVTPIEIASTTFRKGFEKVTNMWIGYYRANGEERQPHPTQKPIGVIEPFISRWTKQGEEIYDPFLGSGTTLIACERLNRKCRAVEISPAYCAVAIQRWVDMTQGIPELIT